jgi:hypothetical protein
MARMADATLDRGLQRLQAEAAPAEGLARTLAAVGIAPTERAPRRNWRVGMRRSLMAAGAVSTLLAAGYLYTIDINPRVTIPTPAMPSPNAYDFFFRAAIPEKQQKDIDAALNPKPSKIPIENDANGHPVTVLSGVVTPVHSGANTVSPLPGTSVDYLNGQPSYETETKITPTGKIVHRYVLRTYSVAEKDAVLRHYESSLVLLRQGLNYTHMAPPVRSPATTLPYLSQDRALARLLELEAEVREERGDLTGAVNSRLDAMQLGAMLPNRNIMIGKLVGIACEAIGRKPLWDMVDRLNAAQARAAARRMEHIVQLHVPFADTLQEEKWFTQATMMGVFRDRRWRLVAPTTLTSACCDINSVQSRFAYVLMYAKLLAYSKRKIMNDWTDYMDRYIRDARLPYCARRINTEEKAQTILLECYDPVTELFAPVFTQARFQDVVGCEVQDKLLLTMLALHAYRQEHRAYPNTLTALVPEYLAAVPNDPFVEAKPLSYHRNGNKFVLYSVGPDGIDDYGRPIEDHSPSANRILVDGSRAMRYAIKPDSKGDIVAGVNMRLGTN